MGSRDDGDAGRDAVLGCRRRFVAVALVTLVGTATACPSLKGAAPEPPAQPKTLDAADSGDSGDSGDGVGSRAQLDHADDGDPPEQAQPGQ